MIRLLAVPNESPPPQTAARAGELLPPGFRPLPPGVHALVAEVLNQFTCALYVVIVHGADQTEFGVPKPIRMDEKHRTAHARQSEFVIEPDLCGSVVEASRERGVVHRKPPHERSGLGGQAGITVGLDNFPGFPDGINGGEFADRLAQQARRFNVELLQAQEVTGLHEEEESKYVTTADGNEYGARAVLIATGSKYRRLGVPGEDELIGAGIHFCATCDGPFYKGQPVAVVGGGNSAGEESLFLTRFADKVTILVRGPEMTASKIVVDKVTMSPKIEVRYNTQVTELHGEAKLSGVTILDTSNNSVEEIHPKGMFVFIGLQPNTAWLPPEIKRDKTGFIMTKSNLETNVPGVFAAGDCRLGSTKQAASAVGEGATAALMVREYLKTM